MKHISRRRLVLALVLAVLFPGLGRAITGQIWKGVLLALAFVLLMLVHPIGGSRLVRWAISFVVWSTFASWDVTYVARVIQELRAIRE